MIRKDQCNLFGIDDILVGLVVGGIIGSVIDTDDNSSNDDSSSNSYDEDKTDHGGFGGEGNGYW